MPDWIQFLFFQVEQIPVVLGPVGTVLGAIYAVATTGISIWLFWKRGEAISLRNTVKAQNDELNTLRPGYKRVLDEKLDLEKLVVELKTKTDLESVIRTSNTLTQLATESLELTRMNQIDTQKFERENTATHIKLVETLDGVVRVGAERYQKVFEAIEQLAATISVITATLDEMRSEMARHFSDDRESSRLNREALQAINADLKSGVRQ